MAVDDDALVGLTKGSASVHVLFKAMTEGRRMIQLEGIQGFGHVRQHGSSLSVEDNERYRNHAQHRVRWTRSVTSPVHRGRPHQAEGEAVGGAEILDVRSCQFTVSILSELPRRDRTDHDYHSSRCHHMVVGFRII